jgi:Fe-S cluster biogenesis protein NfuA
MNDIEKKIIEKLEKIRPFLVRDGGDLEFVAFKDGIVYIKMMGACVDCGLIDNTLKDGIEVILMEEVDGVLGVELAPIEGFSI